MGLLVMAKPQQPAVNGTSIHASPSSRGPSIEVTRKSHRSFTSTFMQASIRPFASQMITPKEAAPAGSPTLTPYESVHERCNTRQLEVCDIKLYEINSRSESTKFLFESVEQTGFNAGEKQARLYAALHEPIRDPLTLNPTTTNTEEDVRSRDWAQYYDGQKRRRPRHIYYFAGGGFQSPPGKEHWKLCSQLTHELTQRGAPTTVYMVSYPLAPNSPASVSIAMLAKLYYKLFPAFTDDLAQSATNDSYRSCRSTQYPEIIFAGDSAGGNIALALTLHMLSTDPTAPAPDGLMLISPTVDMRTTNPGIEKLAKKDPILSPATIHATHTAWCGTDIADTDPRVSPTLGDLSLLARNDVVVNGVLGTYDILSPDAEEFIEKLKAVGVKGKWLIWEKQIHCFPLTYSYGLAEGKAAVEWITSVLNDRK